MKRLKRQVLFALIEYVLAFLIGLVFVLGTGYTLLEEPLTFWIVSITLTIVLTVAVSWLYFKKAPHTYQEGLRLGITFVLVGFVIDLLGLITYALLGQPFNILAYYGDPLFWISILVLIGTTTFVGYAPSLTHKKPAPRKHRKKA